MESLEIISLFQAHKQTAARAEYLRERITFLSENIEDMRKTALEDGIHITQRLTGMPRSGQTQNPVEALAVALADGDDPPHIKAEVHNLRQMQREYRELAFDVRTVEILLKGLKERERFVVEKTLIEGMTWNELEDCHEKHFGVFLTREGLRRARRVAIEKLCRIAV